MFNYSNYDQDYGYTSKELLEAYPRRAYMSGADNALYIGLTHIDLDIDYTCNIVLEGFRVLIHSPFEIPRLDKYYFTLPHDKYVIAAVQPDLITTTERVKSFNPHTRGCYLKNEKFLKYFRLYTQSNCLLECFTNFTLDKCGCIQYFMPRENGTQICSEKHADCVENAESQMKFRDLEKKILGLDQSYCDCKPSCNVLKYNVETSQNDYYDKAYIQKFQKSGNNTDEMERFSHLQIFFKSDQVMTLERKEMYGISDFISNFGGLLGLFTGFSLMSLFEIIYFLTLRIFCNNRIHNSWTGSMC